MKKLVLLVLLCLSVFVVEQGCYLPLDDPGFRCGADLTCPASFPYCMDGVCQSCTTNLDCSASQACQKWKCSDCKNNFCEWSVTWNTRETFRPSDEEDRQQKLLQHQTHMHPLPKSLGGWVGWIAYTSLLQTGEQNIKKGVGSILPFPIGQNGVKLWLGWFSAPNKLSHSSTLEGFINEGTIFSTSDVQGNLYLTGVFQDSLRWSEKKEPLLEPKGINATGNFPSIFVLKLSPKGELVWTQQVVGDLALLGKGTSPCGLAAADKNLFLVGKADQGILQVGDQTQERKKPHIYTVVLDTETGSLVRFQALEGDTFIQCGSVAANATGLALTGSFRGQLSVGSQQFNQSKTNAMFVFWSKLDGSSVALNASQPSEDSAEADGISVSLDTQGVVYITGSYRGTVAWGNKTFASPSATQKAMFVTAWEPGKDFRWTLSSRGVGEHTAQAIAVSPSGKPVVAGMFRGAISLGSKQLTTKSTSQLFVATLKPDGSFEAVQTAQQGEKERSASYGLSFDEEGNLYMSGSVQGNVRLGESLIQSWLKPAAPSSEALPLLFWWRPLSSSFP